MQNIYSNAAYTIITLCGDNMNVRIPGVSEARQLSIREYRMCGLQIRTCLPDLDDSMKDSVWGTRAWTYQEHLLSRRQLFLTPTQSFWGCPEGITSEEAMLNGNDPDIHSQEWSLAQKSTDTSPQFQSYRDICSSYNMRNFSCSSDVYNAFAGIATAIYGVRNYSENFTCGLPLHDIDAALLWTATKKMELRTSSDICLPSWSWSSISGAIGFHHIFGSLVRWTVNMSGHDEKRPNETGSCENSFQLTGHITFPWNDYPDGFPSFHSDESSLRMSTPCLNIALAVAEGCLSETLAHEPIQKLQHMTFDEYNEFAKSKWPSYSEFCHDAFDTLPTCQAPAGISQIPQTLLSTRGQTSLVQISRHATHAQGCHPQWEIKTLNGKCIGILTKPRTIDLTSKEFQLHGQIFKLLAISVGCGDHYNIPNCFPESLKHRTHIPADIYRSLNITYEDCDGTLLRPPPTVNVLLLGEAEPFAYRISLGIVFLRKWAELERKFENITLC